MERIQDHLGDGYFRQELGPFDIVGEPCVATLVSKACPQGSRKAIFYLHGFVDYFFQRHWADAMVERGYNFYALDLHRCGRSLRAGQIPHFCKDVAEYAAEIAAALACIRERDGNQQVIACLHSTGAPIGLHFAHARRADHPFDAAILNSPFLDFNDSWINEEVVIKVVASLGAFLPEKALPGGVSPVYGQSLHTSCHGEWDFDLAWKPIEGFAVRAGWIRAIHQAQRQIQAGLQLPCPVLCLSSSASSRPKAFDDIAMRTDTVLDVDDIYRCSAQIGRDVTRHTIPDGMHDLVLSRPAVRREVYAAMLDWLAIKGL